MRFYFITLVLLLSHAAQAKKVSGVIELNSGEKVEVRVSGVKDFQISPYSKIKSETKKFQLSEIRTIQLEGSSKLFEVRKIRIFEDSSWVVSSRVNEHVSIGLVKYRPCTCNSSYNVSEAYILDQSENNVIIRHSFKDRVIKKRGMYLGVSPELEKELKEKEYRFSAIPELVSRINN